MIESVVALLMFVNAEIKEARLQVDSSMGLNVYAVNETRENA